MTRKRPVYIVGTNMPGYMPDSDPWKYTSFKEACEGLIEELSVDLDVTDDCFAVQELLDAIAAITGLNERRPRTIGFIINNRAYWLSIE